MKSSINWDEVLEQAKEIMKNRVTYVTYECWVKDIKFRKYIDKVVTLEVTEVQEYSLTAEETKITYGQTPHQMLKETLNQITGCVKAVNYFIIETREIKGNTVGANPNLNFNQIKEISMNRLKEIYGDNIDQEILERYNAEMEIISKQEWGTLFMVVHLITKKIHEDKQIVIPTGTINSSFIVYLLGISNINPIEYNIPYETLIGINGEKTPQFELDISCNYLIETLKEYAEELLGKDRVVATIPNDYIKLELLINDDIKIKLISTEILTKIRYLEMITGVNHNDIEINDKEILKLFEIENISQVLGYESNTGKQIFTEIKPRKLEDLVRAYNLLRGTGVWENNIENLIKTHNIQELPCSREDIFLYLKAKGIEKETAYDIMEFVRRGKPSKCSTDEQLIEIWGQYTKIMRKYNVPEWYIKSLERIAYIWPMAHQYSITIIKLYLAWYKAHYPNEYEQATKETTNNTNANKDKEMLERGVITYAEVKKRLKNVPIEQYTKQDLFDRYIAYGSEEELQDPKIQRLLVKNGYTQELLEVATKIDNEVMEEIFETMEDTKTTGK